MFDINQLYSFSLPMTVANTPHNNLRDMSGMDIKMTCSRSTTISIELTSCSRHSTRRHSELCLLLRCPLRKMMQSWSHRLRSITRILRRQPARCLRKVRRPLTAGRLMVHPRITQSLHGLSPPPSKPSTPQLLTMHSTPEDIIKHYTWTSDQPRLYLKQAPTTTTAPSLVKWANHSSRLNGNNALEPMAAQFL